MGLIRRCDPCGSDWKAKIRELWEKYQGCVRGVKAGSITAYPDGDGIADIDGAVTDAIAQQMPTMLDGYVTDSELADTLENYPTDGDLAQTLEDYATTNQLNAKQDKLITGINLRTVNGKSLLGVGDILIRDVLPDTEDANAGDALVLDENKAPSWGAPKTIEPHIFSTLGELATAILDKGLNNMIVQIKPPRSVIRAQLYVPSANDTVHINLDYSSRLDDNTIYVGCGTFNFFRSTTSPSVTIACATKSIRGDTENNNLEIKTYTNNITINVNNIVLWY